MDGWMSRNEISWQWKAPRTAHTDFMVTGRSVHRRWSTHLEQPAWRHPRFVSDILNVHKTVKILFICLTAAALVIFNRPPCSLYYLTLPQRNRPSNEPSVANIPWFSYSVSIQFAREPCMGRSGCMKQCPIGAREWCVTFTTIDRPVVWCCRVRLVSHWSRSLKARPV